MPRRAPAGTPADTDRMSEHVRVRVVDEGGNVLHRIEGDGTRVQRDLNAETWRASLTTQREVFLQVHLGGGAWVTFETHTIEDA